MNSTKLLFHLAGLAFVVAFGCLCCCTPVSYKEDTTTPKQYTDRFKLKKEYQTIPGPSNYSANIIIQPQAADFWSEPHNYKKEGKISKSANKIKSVMPGEKTMKQNDDDDDDDDDGGEYEGLEDYNSGSDKGKKKEHVKQDSMPMMIIREVDMVAMGMPMKGCQKDQKEWSEWSPCSKPCGKGLQSRWRLKPGLQDREEQVRVCHVADCSSNLQYAPRVPVIT